MATSLVRLESTPAPAFKPSHIKFLQATTQDLRHGRPGQFFVEETGNVYGSLTCVLLSSWVNRGMFPPNTTHGGKMVCKSYDGIVPASYIERPLSKDCATCEHLWERHADENGQVPRRTACGLPVCKREKKLLVLVKETRLPHYLVCGGKSEAAANKQLDVLSKVPVLAATQLDLGADTFVTEHFAFEVRGVQAGHNAMMSFGTPRFVESDDEFGPFWLEAIRQKGIVTEA